MDGLILPEPSQTNYNSLAELTEEWEDYEEPKENKFYWIDYDGEIVKDGTTPFDNDTEAMKAIGNWFETEEEAERAVEKLKAWKRLKDKGFRFLGCDCDDNSIAIDSTIGDMREEDCAVNALIARDLNLLFGGRE